MVKEFIGENVIKDKIVFTPQSKKQYDKAFKEAEKARDSYKKADEDIHLSRAEVEKVRKALQWWFHCFIKMEIINSE